MKKPVYKAIDKTTKALRALNLAALLDFEALSDQAEEARNNYDDKSEAWQESEAGSEEIARIESLDNVVEAIREAVEQLDVAIQAIEEIENDAPAGSFD